MSSLFYEKIDTLFERDTDFKVVRGIYRRPEFACQSRWLTMEKLDGSNISILSQRDNTLWRGRTSRAQFSRHIQNHLDLRVEAWHEKLQKCLEKYKLDSIELFGEIYGGNIQKGAMYSKEIKTKFFDVRINQNMYLDHDALIDYSVLLGFGVPATQQSMPIEDIIDMVRNGFDTNEFGGLGGTAEGVVAKTAVPLYNNGNKRLIWKLKHSDWRR